MAAGMGAGQLRERLVLQTRTAQAVAVSSLTQTGGTATAQTSSAHGYSTGDYVTIAGASEAGYNGTKRIAVLSGQSFTFTVTGAPASPATGTITATYASDAQGGRLESWTTVATVPAELQPVRAVERLQLSAIQSDVVTRFRIRRRLDVAPGWRVQWTPSWPPSASAQTLEITGVVPIDDGRTWALLECGRSPR